tara:strand:+ start:1519 stop:1749 length:231 start_codon:yes stop_codon:yes gene_type:complete
MKSKPKPKKISSAAQALSWTEYVLAHLIKAQLKPEKQITVLVPNLKVKAFIDNAISELCEQTPFAWQLITKVQTTH